MGFGSTYIYVCMCVCVTSYTDHSGRNNQYSFHLFFGLILMSTFYLLSFPRQPRDTWKLNASTTTEPLDTATEISGSVSKLQGEIEHLGTAFSSSQ